ncbi:unnamed protein product [Caenorhabditis auriculariae]|uniref:Uncharacterized protein n=1 Tax=Caenorhabditis auriculariae TaxID=2777116 RepID=A0A8S1GTS8_9PELO|nr:unnamed protein product [Caenorhabditis auriculariae]
MRKLTYDEPPTISLEEMASPEGEHFEETEVVLDPQDLRPLHLDTSHVYLRPSTPYLRPLRWSILSAAPSEVVPTPEMLRPPSATQNADSENDHSPALSQKIKVPKKHYSHEDPLQRMETPVFDKEEQAHRKKGPSSAATVLAMSGLFVVGTTLILSGVIVLIVQPETPFVVTGCLFLGVGVAMLLVCVVLQRKNVVKFVLDLNRDLYFLNMNKSYMWKMMFEMRSELPLSSDD